MTDLTKIAVLGMIAVVVFDSVVALISIPFGISYTYETIGSFALYTIFGYLSGRSNKWYVGSIVGGLVGLADSTVGWGVSWIFGRGRSELEVSAAFVATTIVLVVILGLLFGLFGGALSLLVRRNA